MTFSSHFSQQSTHCLEGNNSSLQTLILEQIKQKNLSHTQILSAMGYQFNQSGNVSPSLLSQSPNKTFKQKRALRRLAEVLTSPYLGLTTPSYDFKYSSFEFIVALCQVLAIDQEVYQPLLQPLQQYAHKVLHAVKPVLYADCY